MKINTVDLQAEQDGDLSFLQITDTHLFEDREGELLGVKTFESFNSVVDHALEYAPSASAILATGDISQDQSAASYSHFAERIKDFALSCYSLPGNHDMQPIMQDTLLAEGVLHPQVIESEFWTIILLDSQLAGQPRGFLNPHQLNFLSSILETKQKENNDKSVLICIHHHVLKVGSEWLDLHILSNADDFLAMIKQYKCVKAILSGHVHQDSDVMYEGVRFLSTPSTGVQFKANSDDFATDSKAPGYRHIVLKKSGNIDTCVLRISQGLFISDENSKGY